MTQFNRIVIFLIDRGCSSEAFFLKQIPIPSQTLWKTQQNPSSKRVASINIDGKLKSEYNVVFTGLLVKLRKTIMFSPKKSCQLTCPMYVANWHVQCTNIYFRQRIITYRSIGITPQTHYRDYNRKLRQTDGWIVGYYDTTSNENMLIIPIARYSQSIFYSCNITLSLSKIGSLQIQSG